MHEIPEISLDSGFTLAGRPERPDERDVSRCPESFEKRNRFFEHFGHLARHSRENDDAFPARIDAEAAAVPRLRRYLDRTSGRYAWRKNEVGHESHPRISRLEK